MRVAATLVLLACMAAPAIGADPKSKSAKSSTAIDPAQAQALQAERAAERERLRKQLRALRSEIAAAEASRSEAADALANSERTISDANRRLRELARQQRAVTDTLQDIEQTRQETRRNIGIQQAQLGELAHKQYLADTQDPFRLLFSGDNPNRIQRDLHYLGYLARAQAEILHELNANLDRLRELESQTETRNRELASIAEEEKAERALLLKEQQARRQTLTKISAQLRAQRRQAGVLEQDDKRLGRLVGELAKIIARQAQEARQRERERTSVSRTAPQRSAGTPSAVLRPPAGPRNELTPEIGSFSGDFPKLKGKLRLPLRGELTGRFGGARPEGGPPWKGVFIRAQEGQEVRAIAPGQVVFADWLRGFGNLMIVDHGDQYLSIYGNNEALLKQPGDQVQAGEVLASVGNSGGNPETGLYFELRYKGSPFDPLSWARLQ